MGQIIRISDSELAAKTITVHSGGNPKITGKWGVTGWLPNLPGYLAANHIHPLDHFGVTRLLRQETRGDVRISVYAIEWEGSGSNVLLEVVKPDSVEYVTYQVDGFDGLPALPDGVGEE